MDPDYNETHPLTLEQVTNLRTLVTALLSGKYAQYQGGLKGPSPNASYCCLGVGCDISGLGEWQGLAFAPFASMDHLESGILPLSVQDFYGLTSNGHYFTADGQQETLSLDNDRVAPNASSFSDIAVIIETHIIANRWHGDE